MLFDKIYKEAELKLKDNQKLLTTFKNCFKSTIDTTTKVLPNGEAFVFTGDIPAMWLRDSSAQVVHYLPFVKEEKELEVVIEGLIKRQMRCILMDCYANAFNEEENNNRLHYDKTLLDSFVWERKYEVDSLCYPIQLAFLYYKETGNKKIFDETFTKACHAIVDTFITEQHHENSPYNFERDISKHEWRDTETLQNNGKGLPVNYTGMTWSGFRPSDDACTFGYLIPSNMFAVVILGYMEEIFTDVIKDEYLLQKVKKLKHDINYGIQKYGIYHHPKFGDIYAYETDGFGNYVLMDDANVPSLLSIPYLGYTKNDDPIYQNTRRFILSKDNPFYFEGKVAKGIGSPHTPKDYIWHIALSMQALTASDRDETLALVEMILATDADCNVMHEGINVDDPKQFTRPWFAWANSLFAELVYKTFLK